MSNSSVFITSTPDYYVKLPSNVNNISKNFHTKNRERLSTVLSNTLIVISANASIQYSADTTYPYRQDSNFWYLTGINEPDLVLILDTSNGESTLVLPETNEYKNQWDGVIDKNELTKISGINTFCTRLNLVQKIKAAVKKGHKIGYLKPLDEIVQPYGFYSNPARRILQEELLKLSTELLDIRIDLARLRQTKQQEEISILQEAIDITGESLSVVKSKLSEFKNEKDLENLLTAEFYKRGSTGHGYEPIIASEKNATVIHYNKNSSKIKNNSLLLLDVGAKKGLYSADISRTWAVGKSSNRQKEVFEAVMELQNEALQLLKPGVYLKQYQLEVEELAKKAMKKLNCSNADDKYPHGFSHFLGLDVHDAGDYDLPLSENMILTVEPGIYLPDENIGIRIEDNILITKNGNKIMSKDIPRNL